MILFYHTQFAVQPHPQSAPQACHSAIPYGIFRSGWEQKNSRDKEKAGAVRSYRRAEYLQKFLSKNTGSVRSLWSSMETINSGGKKRV